MKPIIVRRSGGEYSTVTLTNGIIETCWFGNDGISQVVGRTHPQTVASAAEAHIAAYEGKRNA